MALLILDNHDSFTYNLVQMVEEAGISDYEVILTTRSDVNFDRFDRVIISPGPGLPQETGNLMEFLDKFHTKKQILGVCLGHQAIAQYFGARLIQMQMPAHGFASEIAHMNNDPLFKNVPALFRAGRYHSWLVDNTSVPSCLRVIALSEKGEIMGLRHVNYNVAGIQFHPESYITEAGYQIISNFCLPDNTSKQ